MSDTKTPLYVELAILFTHNTVENGHNNFSVYESDFRPFFVFYIPIASLHHTCFNKHTSGWKRSLTTSFASRSHCSLLENIKFPLCCKTICNHRETEHHHHVYVKRRSRFFILRYLFSHKILIRCSGIIWRKLWSKFFFLIVFKDA